MKRRRWLSVLFVIILASGMFAASWRDYQTKYQQASSGPARPIQQVVVQNPELHIEEKCLSCHVGVEDAAMRGAPQPLKTHPGNYLQRHPVREFGCTLCHGGRGDALQPGSAHGEGTSKALLKGDLIQTRCTLCHENHNLKEATSLVHGYELMQKSGCNACHLLEGFEIKRPPCPPLMGIGSKVAYKWAKHWLQNPYDYNPASTMPDPRILNKKYAEALASYLMSLRNARFDLLPDPPKGDPEKGGQDLRLVRCISCHAFKGKGGHLATELGKIGNKTNAKWIFYMLKDTHTYMPDATMPQWSFSDQDAANLTAFLEEEYVDPDLLDEDAKDPTTEERDAATIEMGRRIYKELRCATCHAHSQNEEWVQLGPILTDISAKKSSDFKFGDSDIPRTAPDYIFEKIRHPRAYATKTNLLKMPDYHASDENAKDLALALLSSRSQRVEAARYKVPPELPSVFRPSGAAGDLFDKYQCYSCHAIRGRGYNLAYDLSMEGSRVQRKWLYDYLNVSYSIRPILEERMPIFHFSAEELKVLSDYIMKELTNPELPKDLQEQLTPEMVARGRQLFDDKGCMACHIVNKKGGYVGPSFTTGAASGDKLQAGWIYMWLKNPQAMVPDVIEPNHRFSDAEAKVLTAYLMSIRGKEKP
jgi:mono/diheme cytochrome c family protein